MMRISRLFSFSLCAASAALVLSGCGGGDEFAYNSANNSNQAGNATTVTQTGDIQEPPSQLGKYGGSMTDAAPGDPKTFNLWVSADASSSGAVNSLFDALLGLNSFTQKYEGHLAELPTVSPDNLTWTFKLKPNLKWSDGQPITADDVIFTLDVIYDEKVQTNMRESMMLDAPDGKGGFKRVPLGYKKLDARTIQFKFPVPYAPAREILSFPIAPRHKLEKFWKQGQPANTAFNPVWGVDTAKSNPRDIVASGPWIITSYVPGQRIVYNRNPNYWKKDAQGRPLPYLDQTVTLIVPDFNTTTLKFLAGETDVLNVIQSDYKTVKAQEKKGDFTVRSLGPNFGTAYLSFNLNMKSKPAKANPELFKLFNDVRFRRAVSHSINRTRIAQAVYGGLARPGYGPESPANIAFYNPDIPKFDYDLDAARKLLTEIGLKDTNGDGILQLPSGQPVKFNIITNVENKLRVGIATIVSNDLKKVGITATFSPISFNTLISRADNKPEPGKPYPPFDWQAMVLSFTGSIEPNNGRSIWTSSGNLHQWEPYQTTPTRPWEAQLDSIFRRGAQEMDETKRKAIYGEWQKIVGEQQPLIYTIVPDAINALRNKYGNIKPSSLGGTTWNIEEIYDLNATRDAP